MHRALRGTSLAPALFGSVLGIPGLVVLAAGAFPHIAFIPISDLYHASGVTPSDQATLVSLWQATQGMFNALLAVGLLLLAIGIILVGAAMLRTPAFGKVYGGVSVVLGVVGVVGASFFVVDPTTSIVVLSVFASIIFNLVLGWKVYSLSKTA